MFMFAVLILTLACIAFVIFAFGKAEQQRKELAEKAEAERQQERQVEEQIFTGDWLAGDADGDWVWPNTPLTPEPPFDWKKERLPELGL